MLQSVARHRCVNAGQRPGGSIDPPARADYR
jgi:hypothetical protein